MNWFVYCGNNPLSATDPTGLAPVVDDEGNIILRGLQVVNTRTRKEVDPYTGKETTSQQATREEAIGVLLEFEERKLENVIEALLPLGKRPLVTTLKATINNADLATGLINAVNGETDYTKTDRLAHKLWNPGEGFTKEYRLPSDRKVDAINFEDRIVLELKPNNPKAIRRGKTPVNNYRSELEAISGLSWEAFIVTY